MSDFNAIGYAVGIDGPTLLQLMELTDATTQVRIVIPGEQYDTTVDLTPKLLATHVYRRVDYICARADGEKPVLLAKLKPMEKVDPIKSACECAI